MRALSRRLLRTETTTVVWFFERAGTFIRCETRDVADMPGSYELVITDGNGERVERFDDSESLARRQEDLQFALGGAGWQGPFGRFL